MKKILALLLLLAPWAPASRAGEMPQRTARKTEVSIRGDAFRINGRPTYKGRTWQGRRIEGLLLNARLVQGIFDDLNPETRGRWAYPDTGQWDPERNTRQVPGYRPMPILFNEDDHFDFDKPLNNMKAAVGEYASWGYFDPGLSNYADGYQCPPVNWSIQTDRKRQFFAAVKEITGRK